MSTSHETPRRSEISAFVICMNEERNIRRCLESIKWCDEIVVVDSGSTDETLSICREYTEKIIRREWPGFVEQKRFGLSQCRCDWVLNIDADEEVSSELKSEIVGVLERHARGEVPEQGFELLRTVFYLGRWWRRGGWYPEYRLRLFQRASASWGGHNPHERALVAGRTGRLRAELYHYTYSDLSGHVRSLNSLSSAAAASMLERGIRASVLSVVFNPLVRFLKFYFVKRGYLEGFRGLLVAYMEAYYVFMKYAKLWELADRGDSQEKELTAPASPPMSASASKEDSTNPAQNETTTNLPPA